MQDQALQRHNTTRRGAYPKDGDEKEDQLRLHMVTSRLSLVIFCTLFSFQAHQYCASLPLNFGADRGRCPDVFEIFINWQVYAVSAEVNLQQRNSVNHELPTKHLHTQLRGSEERTEADTRQVTCKWGCKLKVIVRKLLQPRK